MTFGRSAHCATSFRGERGSLVSEDVVEFVAALTV
jgi:hypothetical protein